MSAAELVQNIVTSAEQLVAAVPGGMENIRNIHIKTPDSMAIPVYTSLGTFFFIFCVGLLSFSCCFCVCMW